MIKRSEGGRVWRQERDGSRFGGVVVITSASHAEGPRFEPGSNHNLDSVFDLIKAMFPAYQQWDRLVDRPAASPASKCARVKAHSLHIGNDKDIRVEVAVDMHTYMDAITYIG